MLTKTSPHQCISVEPNISKRTFFEKYGNQNDYHEICERCPIIDRVYKNSNPNVRLGYFCQECASRTDPRSPLERLLFGFIHTEDVLNLRTQTWFQGNKQEAGEHVLSPIYLQEQVNFDNTFSSRYTVIDIAFHLWKLLYTINDIIKSREFELKYGETSWISSQEREESQKAYITIASYAIYCDGHEFHERTKEQAARDRSVDRKLQQMGWHVFRFTGSEIFRAPEKCMADITNQIAIDVANNQHQKFLPQ